MDNPLSGMNALDNPYTERFTGKINGTLRAANS